MTEQDRIVKAFLKPLRKTIKSIVKIGKEHPWAMENLGDKRGYYLYLTYGHIQSLARSLERLVSARHYTGAIAVARSMLETHADIVGIVCKEGYPDLLDAISNRELEKYLNIAERNTELPVFESILDDIDIDIDEAKANVREALRDAEDKLENNSNLTVYARFKFAGLEEVYDQYYRALSPAAHGNITDLTKRYMKFGASSVRFRWPPLRNSYGSDIVMVVSFIPRILMDSARAFLKFHEIEKHTAIDESLKCLKKIESNYEDRIREINERRRNEMDELADRLDALKDNTPG